MVGGAARAALVAVSLAILCLCLLGAQGEVTLDTASAKKSGEGVAVDLKTSGAASFKLERFTMGNWVFVWSPQLSAPDSEQVVSCDLSETGGLLNKVTLSRDGKRNGVRLYIGANSDARDVVLIPWKDGARVLIPPAKPRVTDTIKLIRAQGEQTAPQDATTVTVSDFGGAGTLDYQLTPVLPPTGADTIDSTDNAGNDTVPPSDDSMQAPPALPPPPGKGKGSTSKPAGRLDSTPGRITTLSGSTLSPGMEAKVSLGMVNPATANGKDALRNITIDFFEVADEPLNSAIQLLVAPTDFNIIVDSSVGENSVSLSFKEGQTDLKSALDLLARTYKLEYIVENGTIVVASKDKVYGNLLPFETRLFVLNWADPRSVRDILISTGIVTETQIEYYGGETEYPTVNDSTRLSDTGADIEDDILPIETNISSTPRNAVLVHGTPDLLEYVAKVVGELDRKPMQIQLEVRVCEANENAIKELGIVVDQSISTVFQEVGNSSGDSDSFPFSGFDANQLGSFNRTGGFNFGAELRLQQDKGNVRVLSQPTITTTDGKQAIWFAGERVPYIAEPQVSTGSNFQAPKIKFISVGVMLSFKPRLDRDGLITIDANPAISSLVEFLDLGAGASAPRTQNRQLHSTIRVHDGETFSLAGLITENERKRTIKVPGFGDLPLVGSLFRDKRTERNRTEIIVLVTPKILE